MNVVDSSAWLEYFADGPNAGYFSRPIQDVKELVVPTISILEVFKCVLGQRGEHKALQAVALMQQGRVVELDTATAMAAAKLGVERQLPLADSVILATAQARGATIWTQDADFDGLPGVNFRAKR